jgi:hypothetical protein
MHQYNVGAAFKRIAIDGSFYQVAGSICFSHQETSTVEEALVANFFCHFSIPRELHSDQGCKFKFHLLQEVLQCLGVSKLHTTPLHYWIIHNYARQHMKLASDRMNTRYNKLANSAGYQEGD